MNVEQCDVAALPRSLEMAAKEGRAFEMVIVEGSIDALTAVIQTVRSSVGPPTPRLVLLSSEPLEKTRELVADAVLSTPIRAKVFWEKLCELVPSAPVRPASSPQLPIGKQPTPAKSGALRVLVADDNLVNQKLACALLARLGCEVDTAEDGAVAIEKVSRQEYGLVFMDLVMPGTDGFAATAAIRNLTGQRSTVPIVALTASATIEDRDHCFEVGMDDFITKPIRSEQLAQCLTKWLRK